LGCSLLVQALPPTYGLIIFLDPNSMNQTTTLTTKSKPKTKKEVRDIRADALKIARGIKVDGQTNADTKAIASGIQRGMEQFLRQQSEKTRDLDKRVKKVKQLAASASHNESTATVPANISKASRLPWVLLGLSWIFFVGVVVFFHKF
jgi:hypothetical protein